MLAIQKSNTAAQPCTPNVLPCKIHHNGPVNASSRHWDPKSNEHGKEEAYFRGRKLQGHTVKLPDGYQGVVVEKSERFLPRTTKERAPLEDDEESDAEEDVPEDVKVLPQIASFDRFTVWAHEAAPATAEDPYVKGVEEWMAFAQAMNSFEDKTTTT